MGIITPGWQSQERERPKSSTLSSRQLQGETKRQRKWLQWLFGWRSSTYTLFSFRFESVNQTSYGAESALLMLYRTMWIIGSSNLEQTIVIQSGVGLFNKNSCDKTELAIARSILEEESFNWSRNEDYQEDYHNNIDITTLTSSSTKRFNV